MTKKIEKEEKQVSVIDNEKIDHWRSLAWETCNEFAEVDKVFTDVIDSWRELRNDIDVGSIMGVIQRSIQHTVEKAEKLKTEIYEFKEMCDGKK